MSAFLLPELTLLMRITFGDASRAFGPPPKGGGPNPAPAVTVPR
jgi:hypothetical protein